MNAQTILDECNTRKFNPRQFREEMNISWLINDVVKQYLNDDALQTSEDKS